MKDLKAKVIVELDGHSIELISQELYLGVEKARKEGNGFRAKLLEKLADDLQDKKRKFHEDWLKKIMSRSYSNEGVAAQTKKKRTRKSS